VLKTLSKPTAGSGFVAFFASPSNHPVSPANCQAAQQVNRLSRHVASHTAAMLRWTVFPP
jgi:hypothetical protein